MRQASVNTHWVPGAMPPPFVRETFSFADEEHLTDYRSHLVNALRYYSESTTMTVKDLTYSELAEWASSRDLTPDDAFDLMQFLLCIPREERLEP